MGIFRQIFNTKYSIIFFLYNTNFKIPFFSFQLIMIPEQKSILTDSDWKKLWMRGGINPDSKLDNNLETSDSPMFEDSEVSFSTQILN